MNGAPSDSHGLAPGAGARRRGFSLVEVLCALLILGVGIAGVAQGITVALRSSKDSERQTTAALLAAGRIETLRAEGTFFAGEEEGDFGKELAHLRWRQKITETAIEGLHEVTVTIEMPPSGEMANSAAELYELKTLLFKVPYEPLDETLGSQRQTASRGAHAGRRER
jgi:prepilin-type N-terminal cleavage/methylation domain-containing protein